MVRGRSSIASTSQLGVIDEDWVEWDDPRHKVRLIGVGPAKLAALNIRGEGKASQIWLYDDDTIPTRSAANMKAYLEKLATLMRA